MSLGDSETETALDHEKQLCFVRNGDYSEMARTMPKRRHYKCSLKPNTAKGSAAVSKERAKA